MMATHRTSVLPDVPPTSNQATIAGRRGQKLQSVSAPSSPVSLSSGLVTEHAVKLSPKQAVAASKLQRRRRRRLRNRRRSNSLPKHLPKACKQQVPRLFFQSPRCNLDDQQVFPAAVAKSKTDRWDLLSKQAGQHQQDATLYRIPKRSTAQALKFGMPRAAAARVTTLFLPDQEEHQLPEWLDVVSSMFVNLEHLYLNTTADTEDDEEAAASRRLQRLYVLYRLPDLRSIDGVPIEVGERNLARPSHPNGQRVNRSDWVETSSENLTDASRSNKVNAVEVSLSGSIQLDFWDAVSPRRPVERPLLDNDDDVSSEDEIEIPIWKEKSPARGKYSRDTLDLDRFEYVAVESSAAHNLCGDWGVACGSLSIPYYFKRPKTGTIEKSKLRFRRRQVGAWRQESLAPSSVKATKKTETKRPRVVEKEGSKTQLPASSLLDTVEPAKPLSSPRSLEEKSTLRHRNTSGEPLVHKQLVADEILGKQETKKTAEDKRKAVDRILAATEPMEKNSLTVKKNRTRGELKPRNSLEPQKRSQKKSNKKRSKSRKQRKVHASENGSLAKAESIEIRARGDEIKNDPKSSNGKLLEQIEMSAATREATCPETKGRGRQSSLRKKSKGDDQKKSSTKEDMSTPSIAASSSALDANRESAEPVKNRKMRDLTAKITSPSLLFDQIEQSRARNGDNEFPRGNAPRGVDLLPANEKTTDLQAGTLAAKSPPRVRSLSHAALFASRIPDEQDLTEPNFSMEPFILPRSVTNPVMSPSRRISGSESLTSPFPMQFRTRAAKSCSPSRELKVTTKLNEDESDGASAGPSPPPAPRQNTPNQLHTIDSVESPLAFTGSSERKILNASELPPPCPRPSPLRLEPKKKKKSNKLRQKQLSRSTSIMDDDDGEDHEGSDEENIQEDTVGTE